MTDTAAAALAATAMRVQARLEALLAGPGDIPERLLAAMRHAMLGGGKRLRPTLMVEVARLFGRDDDGVLEAAVALECIHCYSLVHDDLPAMDDDDLRRGRPTVHRAFDEATAILAGDALAALAFETMASPGVDRDAGVRVRLVADLARASGGAGMIGGQILDLAAEGRFGGEAVPPGENGVRLIQAMKTGALIVFACEAGARLAHAPQSDVRRLAAFGAGLGLAFQIADDLLDATGDAARLGKATAKDAAAGKATLVDLMGAEAARARLADLVAEADGLLTGYGPRAATLSAIARFVAARDH